MRPLSRQFFTFGRDGVGIEWNILNGKHKALTQASKEEKLLFSRGAGSAVMHSVCLFEQRPYHPPQLREPLLATSCTKRDNTCSVWLFDHREADVERSGLLAQLSGHADDVLSACVTNNRQYVITTSKDNSARIWNMKELEEMKKGKSSHRRAVHLVRAKSIAFKGRSGLDSMLDVESMLRARWAASLIQKRARIHYNWVQRMGAGVLVEGGNMYRRTRTQSQTHEVHS